MLVQPGDYLPGLATIVASEETRLRDPCVDDVSRGVELPDLIHVAPAALEAAQGIGRAEDPVVFLVADLALRVPRAVLELLPRLEIVAYADRCPPDLVGDGDVVASLRVARRRRDGPALEPQGVDGPAPARLIRAKDRGPLRRVVAVSRDL